MCIDIQSEHNYVVLSSIIQRISYMFRPLLGHHQVALSLQSNCITQSAYLDVLIVKYSYSVVQPDNSQAMAETYS
jgi:hypothetical protein